MRGKISKGVCAIALASPLLVAGAAHATFQPTVLYDPPVIKALDYATHMSQEDVTVTRAGPDFVFHAEVTPFAGDARSEPGCGPEGDGYHCPVAGIELVVVKLGGLDDSAFIHLGASARRVKQRVMGQTGLDTLIGRRGSQRLVGGDDNDTLRGGPGKDVLIGGPGEDVCKGGPGKDVLKSCE